MSKLQIQDEDFDYFSNRNDDDDNGEQKLALSDFTILKVVGRGSYGKVYKAKNNIDGQIYALKAMKKDALMKRE